MRTTNTIVSILLVLVVIIVLTGGGVVIVAAAQQDNNDNNDSDTLRTISTFRLDLTMERLMTTSSNNNATEGEDSATDTMDSTIQSIAEEHLYKIYEMQYRVAPTRVLLTVVSDEDDDDASAAIAAAAGGDDSSGLPGIIVKSAYLGGVVGFPTLPDDDDEGDEGFVLPTRSELDEMTLTAFEVPGYGEYFLRELQRSDDVGLDGLILTEAVSVDGVIENAEEFEGGGDVPSSSSSNQQQQQQQQPGMVMIAGHPMNVWAIAAVAALGAMFLVIVLCTSILYCDWRARRLRRDGRKRDRIIMQTSAAAEAHRALHGGSGSGGDGKGGGIGGCVVDLEMGNNKSKKKKRISSASGGGGGAGGSRAGSRRGSSSNNNNNDRSSQLQVVIPSASGETEDLDSPESYTSSKQIGSSARYPSSGSTHRGGSNNPISPNKMVVVTKKYRRSNGGGSSSTAGAAGTNNKEQQQQQAIVQQVQDPSQSPPEENVSNNNDNNNIITTGVGGTSLGASIDALSFPTNDGSNNNNNNTTNKDDYSVGEDTAMMLYPVYNRGRLASKDYEGYVSDDFDGYSIDGMSAIGDGGVSQFGGSGGAGGSSRGGKIISGMKKTTTTTGSGSGGMGGSNADIYYAGNVPRDFDSVWGDDTDDEDMSSRISRDRSSKIITTATTSAYADLNQSLNQLVEQEMIYEGTEEGSQSGTASVDSASVTSGASGKHDDQAGAFTLELLGGKGRQDGSIGGGGGVGGDDDDSILGGMNDDLSTIAGPADDNTAKYLPTAADDDVSVNSTPSWAAPIQGNNMVKGIQNSVKNLFRRSNTTSPLETESDLDLILQPQESNDTGTTATTVPAANNSYSSDSNNVPNKVKSIFLEREKEKEQRTKEKFVTSLLMNSDDNISVGSNRSSSSNCSNRSTISIGSNGSRESKKSHASLVRDATTALASNERVLGTSTSYDEKDEDPAAMIDNINSMLSECREILDTESGRSTPAGRFQ